MTFLETTAQSLTRDLATAAAALPHGPSFCSLRWQRRREELVSIRQNVLEPVETNFDEGLMVTVFANGGMGYCATPDVSTSGIKAAVERAFAWAGGSAARAVTNFGQIAMPVTKGRYASIVGLSWDNVPLPAKIERLRAAAERLKVGPAIVDWRAALLRMTTDQVYVTLDGAETIQSFDLIVPELTARAHGAGETQSRTLHGNALCRQGGLEVLEAIGFEEAASRIGEEALELLHAPNCPTGTMDLVLAPDQMILQIHESIGHPLELDRILGDERNYAGTSFVSLDMIGRFAYGSPQLNVTFDPSVPGEFASYAFDDEGLAAEKTYLIKDGVLQCALGGVVSQQRSGVKGVANARAVGWNRPPLDRMANLNLEPANASFDELIAAVDNGIYMCANRSWSIDDSRDKFQFGCEWGRLIKNGKWGPIVKNPNYRGRSVSFWHSLAMVGNAATRQVLGTPYCGKAEPNQAITVGHASPACLFRQVEVFGGEA